MDIEILNMVKDKHPEKQLIFKLARALDEELLPYYFNFDDEVKPTPFNLEGNNPESIDWANYPFRIEIILRDRKSLSVIFNHGERKDLLELCDLNTDELFTDMTVESIIDIAKKYF